MTQLGDTALVRKTAMTLALAVGTVTAAHTDTSAGATVNDGDVLAAPCAGCHREEAAGSGAIPSLRGLSADEIADKLHAYRDGELEGTVMNRLARGYSEAEIRRLADTLGTRTPPGAAEQ